jgi:hypothetical protein
MNRWLIYLLLIVLICFGNIFAKLVPVEKKQALTIATNLFKEKELGLLEEYDIQIVGPDKEWIITFIPKETVYITDCNKCPEWTVTIHKYTGNIIFAQTLLIKHNKSGQDSDKTKELNKSRANPIKRMSGGCNSGKVTYK